LEDGRNIRFFLNGTSVTISYQDIYVTNIVS